MLELTVLLRAGKMIFGMLVAPALLTFLVAYSAQSRTPILDSGMRGAILLLLAVSAVAVLWRRSSIWIMWPLFALAMAAYGAILSALPGMGVPVRASYVATVDAWLGLGETPTVRLQEIFYDGSPGWLDWVWFAVYASFFALWLMLLLVWYVDRAQAVRCAKATVLAFFISLAGFAVVPTAPPWMASEMQVLPEISRIAETLVGSSAHERASSALGGNPVAAMPSVHMAAAVLVALGMRSVAARLGWIALAYPAAMGFTLIYFGEHYLADIVSGSLVAAAAWWLSRGTWGWQRIPRSTTGRTHSATRATTPHRERLDGVPMYSD